jgi:caffeoyl-CoA O-methyltransferase
VRQLVPELIERYALDHSSPESAAMAALQQEAKESLSSPGMLSGPVVGRLLELLVWSTRAKLVLEIGTYAGYSALAMAAGLPDDGRIITCERSDEYAEFARRHIATSPYAHMVDLRVGPALETIQTLPGPFDFVFIDADKVSYRAYYEAVLNKLSPQGLIAVDNTLWSGRVLDERDPSADTRALAEFNDMLAHDERVGCVMLTVRDGVTLIRRRSALRE